MQGFSGPAGSALNRWLQDGPQLVGSFAGIVGAWPVLVARVDVPPAVRAAVAAGLPDVAASEEAVAVRLRRAGAPLAAGPGVRCEDLSAVLTACRARGRSSTAVLRADPSLLCELQAGTWFDAAWRARAIRRLAVRLEIPAVLARRARRPLVLRTLADAAFWRGVRETATPQEWDRLTRSSYCVLIYHRLAGEGRPGQEQLDLSARTFRAQLRLLRRLRFRPLSPDDQARFHTDPAATIPRRSYVVTADDGFADNFTPLLGHARRAPQLFVPTAEVGAAARWAAGEPLLDWEQLHQLARAGVVVGSHTRTHASLPDVDPARLRTELAGSLAELRDRLARPVRILAYPHGRHDHAVRAAAIDAGFRLAYTTAVGRNGAGTDPWTLRRVGPKQRDSLPAFLWKAVTGELIPPRWERRRLRREERAARR